ncbi:helix-turn-helix transcriptional regulator [uncultured Sphingomonas sp.]|uniref:PadR family transcriptional regulator n=1 Tax=uncultured Sphingomonas sp. TaxID=158754 RepID=UPI0025CEF55B|nr:helix-turn-helix transcriptional regulator [uncultured Sphingomonas sp.]
MIGKMEEVVLLATIRAGAGSLPSAIYEQIVATVPAGEKEPAFGAIYTTIMRMAAKGMLSEGSKTDERGRPRKSFTVTADGTRALQAGLSQTAALGGFTLRGALA